MQPDRSTAYGTYTIEQINDQIIYNFSFVVYKCFGQYITWDLCS